MFGLNIAVPCVCSSLILVATIQYSDKKQLLEEKVYFSSQFQVIVLQISGTQVSQGGSGMSFQEQRNSNELITPHLQSSAERKEHMQVIYLVQCHAPNPGMEPPIFSLCSPTTIKTCPKPTRLNQSLLRLRFWVILGSTQLTIQTTNESYKILERVLWRIFIFCFLVLLVLGGRGRFY